MITQVARHTSIHIILIKIMKPQKISSKSWRDSGLLDNIPEDQKKYVIKLFNHAYSNMYFFGDNEYEVLIYPIIVRIYKEKHINFSDVGKIIVEIKKQYKNIDFATGHIFNVDVESEFVHNYIENYINK